MIKALRALRNVAIEALLETPDALEWNAVWKTKWLAGKHPTDQELTKLGGRGESQQRLRHRRWSKTVRIFRR